MSAGAAGSAKREEQRMLDANAVVDRGCRYRPRIAAATLGVIAVLAATASPAAATLRITNVNEPAGDPTAIGYRLVGGTLAAPIDFALHDADFRTFGLGAGTFTVQALPPAGWRVRDIQCVGPAEGSFVVDVPNGRVTITHQAGFEQTCAFTSTSGSAGPATGVAPAPPPQELPKVVLPRRPALLRVIGGRRFAAATLRLTRRSVIRAQLLQRGTVVGATRTVRNAGVHVVRVRLNRAVARQLRGRGLRRVTLTLRVVVAPRPGAARVFRFAVRVRL
jgi:hypothetical protein